RIIFPDVMQQSRITCELFATKCFALPCRGIRDIAEMLFQPLSFPQAIFCMSNIDHTYSSPLFNLYFCSIEQMKKKIVTHPFIGTLLSNTKSGNIDL
ncbi:MAG TPA: hypothetical protein VEP90_02630, partial [Methylomirabilota bacterium]|nr:hypothetical protein [Methylomirabilota bacterium]